MANWSVALARKTPVLKPRSRKRHSGNYTPSTPLPDKPHRTNDNVFKNICEDDVGDHDCVVAGCERVRINVSGMVFITRRGVLERHPDTLLGCKEKREQYYDRVREEYFFDRHRPTFEAIFNYYQYGGRIKRPQTVSDDIFIDELHFYELEKEKIDEYKVDEGYTESTYEYPENETMRTIWTLFEYPETSKAAFVVGLMSVICTVTSIIAFTVETLYKSNCETKSSNSSSNETLYYFNGTSFTFTGNLSLISMGHDPEMTSAYPPGSNVTAVPGVGDESSVSTMMGGVRHEDVFFVIETICNLWFTFEACVRFCVCPNKCKFFKDFKNVIDVVAIVPYYVSLGNKFSPSRKCGEKDKFGVLRILRLIRVFKLAKHSQGLQILMLTFRTSFEGLTLFVLALFLCILIFSSMIYYCEIGEPDAQIRSIPEGFWWAVITMCTVGYGDVVPVGTPGKLVGTICTLAGVLTLAIPVPIITENFNKFYVHRLNMSRRSERSPTFIEKCKSGLQESISDCQEKLQCLNGRGGGGALTNSLS